MIYWTKTGHYFSFDGTNTFLKGVNICPTPTDRGWDTMWINYDSVAIGEKLAYLGTDYLSDVNVIRTMMDVPNGSIEPQRLYDNFDDFLEKAKGYGVYVILNLLAWTLPDTTSVTGSKGNISATEAWDRIYHFIDRFKNDNRILAWQLRNEWMNAVQSDAGGFSLITANHVDKITPWLKSLYDNIKAIDSNHLVSTGGNTPELWQKAALATNEAISDYNDFIELHVYPSGAGTKPPRQYMQSTRSISIPYLKQYLFNKGLNLADMPFTIGETGLETISNGEAEQYKWGSELVKYMSWEDIQGLFWWSLQDQKSSIKFGLLDNNGNKREVYNWYKNWQINLVREEQADGK